MYGAWSWFFRVKLHEAERPPTEYQNLTAFFTRRLRDGARVVDPRPHVMVSPVDGTVVSVSADMGAAGVLSQVKGIQYHLTDFLGIPTPAVKPGNALYSAVLYLSPGDYHRFHSPTEWTATARTHIAGQLLPVNPLVAYFLPSLFCANERVAVFGTWAHGFYSYTAVGATNVGSMRLTFDPTLVTNTYRHDWETVFNPLEAAGVYGNRFLPRPRLLDSKTFPAPVPLKRGDDVGLFELGSTIVLVFEAPTDFRFSIRAGDKVRVGQAIGRRTDPAAVVSPVAGAPDGACAGPAAPCGAPSPSPSPRSAASTATDDEARPVAHTGWSAGAAASRRAHRLPQAGSGISLADIDGRTSVPRLAPAPPAAGDAASAALLSPLAAGAGDGPARRLSSESGRSGSVGGGGRARSSSAFAVLEGSRLAGMVEGGGAPGAAVAPCDPAVGIPAAQLRRLVVDSSGRRRDRSTTVGSAVEAAGGAAGGGAGGVSEAAGAVGAAGSPAPPPPFGGRAATAAAAAAFAAADHDVFDVDDDDADFRSCCSWAELGDGDGDELRGAARRSRAASTVSAAGVVSRPAAARFISMTAAAIALDA